MQFLWLVVKLSFFNNSLSSYSIRQVLNSSYLKCLWVAVELLGAEFSDHHQDPFFNFRANRRSLLRLVTIIIFLMSLSILVDILHS
jgi:hypothetical protein